MGGSGGGTSSQAFPDYAQRAHKDFVNNYVDSDTFDTLNRSIVDLMTDMLSPGTPSWAGNPYATATAYSGATRITNMEGALSSYDSVLDGLESGLSGLVNELITNTRLDAEIAAFRDMIEDDYENKVMSRFEVGMRDLNAVDSSSFAIGRGLILASKERDIAKFAADLYLKAKLDIGLQLVSLDVQARQGHTQSTVEVNRIAGVMEKETVDRQLEINAHRATWEFEVFQYGTNVLSVGMAGLSHQPRAKISQGASVLGGAMSGAAIGASVSGPAAPYGAAIGAVVGGVAGYLAN